MPQIFDKIGRDKIKEQLLEAGFELIKLYGLKKTSVADISKKAGIATGTFYNFFPSKEEFVYQLIVYKRNATKEAFSQMTASGKADKDLFREYLRQAFLSDNNIFDYLSEEEINMLNSRWPETHWKNTENDERSTKWLFDNLKHVSPNCDWKVFVNLCKSISLIRYGKDRLHEDVYEETMNLHINTIVQYVFDS